MDRYENVTRRIERSLWRDRVVALVAPLAFVGALAALAVGYARLGSAVTASQCASPIIVARATHCPMPRG